MALVHEAACDVAGPAVKVLVGAPAREVGAIVVKTQRHVAHLRMVGWLDGCFCCCCCCCLSIDVNDGDGLKWNKVNTKGGSKAEMWSSHSTTMMHMNPAPPQPIKQKKLKTAST
jgi:streptolysin S family bacteriocin protoxin